jgi:hypothetical protein
METILYDKNGIAVAYITSDYHETVYLWEGLPVAYLYEQDQVYGFNGRHLGWFKNEVLFTHGGERIGFTFNTCPVSIIKPPVKGKKYSMDEMRPRWGAPPLPKLGYNLSGEALVDFLKKGQAFRFQKEAPPHESSD